MRASGRRGRQSRSGPARPSTKEPVALTALVPETNPDLVARVARSS
ncbi:MAG: hypothetical protein ACRDRI_03135 [Pseudonocardiaceae bacterium]